MNIKKEKLQDMSKNISKNIIYRKNIISDNEIINIKIFKLRNLFFFNIFVHKKTKNISKIKNRKKSNSNYKKYMFVIEDLNGKSLINKHLNDFIMFFKHDKFIRESIENETFNYYELPKKLTTEHLKEISISYNVKKINEGDSTKIKELKIWKDEYSFLNKEALLSFMTDDEVSDIKKALKESKYSKKTQNKLENVIFRWCIRGLNTKKAIEKAFHNEDKSTYFMLRFFKKNK